MDATYLKTYLNDVTRAKSSLGAEGRTGRYLEMNGGDYDYILALSSPGVGVQKVGGGLQVAGIPAGPSPQVAANKFRILDAENTVAYDSATVS